MTTFGSYEVVREKHHTGRGTVWLASGHGKDPTDQFIVKSIQPEARRQADLTQTIARFLDQADVQKKVAAGGGSHWAPIHESGKTDGGAYYATDLYSRSLRAQILGKVRANGDALYSLVSGIVRGLEELDDACHRPHGNLKPDNILLERSEGSPHPDVYLTDPLATESLDPQTNVTRDLRALGGLIFQLVAQQEFRQGLWPARSGTEWSRIGKTGEAWRELCNKLLDPKLDQSGLTLQKLAEEDLPKLEPKPPVLTLPRLIVGSVLAVLVIGVGIWLMIPPPPSNPDDVWGPGARERWEQLCANSYDWYLPLRHNFNQKKIDYWKNHKDLKGIYQQIELIRDKPIVCNPQLIANRAGADIKDLKNNPPETVKNGGKIRDTRFALEALNGLSHSLAQWPVHREIDQRIKVYETRGWADVQAYLQDLSDQALVSESGGGVDLAAGVKRIIDEYHALRDQGVFDQIETLYKRLTLDQVPEAISGDSGLLYDRYRFFAIDFLKAENVQEEGYGRLVEIGDRAASLLDTLEGVKHFDDLAQTLENEIRLQIELIGSNRDTSGFADRLGSYTTTYQSTLNQCISEGELGALTRLFKDWKQDWAPFEKSVLAHLQSEPSSPDPRPKWGRDTSDQIHRIDLAIEQVRSFGDSDNIDGLSQKLGTFRDTQAQIGQLPWSVRSMPEINERIRAVTDGLAGLDRAVQDRLAGLERPLDPGDDSRLALGENLQDARKQIAELRMRDVEHSEAFSRDLGQMSQEFAEVEGLGWVVGHELQIRAVVGQIRPRLTRLKREVFEKLDPRQNWDWEEMVREITDGIGRVSDSLLRDSLRNELQRLETDIRQLEQMNWTAQNREKVVLSHDALNLRLNGLRDKADIDPRPSFLKNWEVFLSLAGEVIALREEIGDPGVDRLRGDLKTILGKAEALRGRGSWPDDPESKSRIRGSVEDLGAELDRVFAGLDPRPLWIDQHLQEIGKIERALQAPGSRSDAESSDYRGQLGVLNDKTESILGRDWARDDSTAIVEDIRSIRALTRVLREKVIPDPREQVDWKHLLKLVGGEIERLEQGSDAHLSIAKRLDSTRQRVDELLNLPWDPSMESDVVRQMTKILRDLQETYADAVRAAGEIEGVGSQVLNALWRTHRDELLQQSDDLLSLLAKIDRLRDFLFERYNELPIGLPDRDRPRNWKPGLAVARVYEVREEALRQGTGSFELDPSGAPIIDDSLWTATVRDYVDWHDQIGDMMTQFKLVEQALSNGYGLDKPIAPDRPTSREIHGRWSDERVWTYPFDVPVIFEPVVTRLNYLREIEGSFDRTALLRLASDSLTSEPMDAAVVIAVWRKLPRISGDPWPGSVRALKQEHAISQWLDARVFQDTQQQTTIKAELDSEKYKRWVRCFASLTTEEDIEQAVRIFIQSRMEETRVPGWARYNLQLSKFFAFVRDSDPKEQESVLLDKITGFVDQIRALPDEVVTEPQITSFMDKITELQRKNPANAGVGDLSKVGPRSSAIWKLGEWTEEVSDDQTTILYKWQLGRNSHTLRFVRVQKRGAVPGSFYLCTTEVSLGLFRDAVEAIDKWDEMARLLNDPQWKGPKAWVWKSTAAKSKGIKRNKGWTVPNPMLVSGGGRNPDYFDKKLVKENPTYDHPMQYVSPGAAYYFSRLLGCRFASGSEWGDALHAQLNGNSLIQYVNDNQPNLRDATWLEQKEHVAGLIGKGVAIEQVVAPYSGSFWRDKSSEAWSFNDKNLWFEPVESRRVGVFAHLVGNVAEYVLDLPGAGSDSGLGPDVSVDSVNRALSNGRVGVIGGSSQSPIGVGVDQVQPIASASQSQAYSDIGIRLAFSAPSEPLLVKLQNLLDQQRYLVGSSEDGDS